MLLHARIIDLTRRFARQTRGNVAMIFALAVLPVTLLSGGAIDFNQAMNARSRLSQALDAAALAVGSNTNLSDADAADVAARFIAANYPGRELGTVQNVRVSIDDVTDTVIVTGEAEVRTTLLGLAGINTITVGWESEVQRARQRLELAMVLDNTGSMSGSKIRNLRDSAALLNEILFDAADERGDVKIGLVPFASTVNVGTANEAVWWMDPDGRNPLHSEWFDQPANRWDLFDDLRRTSWEGCVEARAIPFDIEDIEPNPGRPETLFMPYFAPDEPDRGGRYNNNYLNDGLRGSVWERLMNIGKYRNGRPRNGNGPNEGCTARPITPLTDNERTVDRAISQMEASGTTNIPLGVSWGVRVLSPQAPYTEGVPYDDDEVVKAMVVLTDGENYISTRGSHFAHSDYSGYGYIRTGRLGVTSSSRSQVINAMNARTAAACEYAKRQGIRVYTITFQVSSSSTRQLMRECASNPSLYFDSPSSSALRDAFEMIAGDLTNLRISR
ncbi:TadE/TadG family type IV pilus assembly protein [Maricaulis sp. CAU 1757]